VKGAAGGGGACSEPFAHVYVSYTCVLNENTLIFKMIYIGLLALLNVFGGWYYLKTIAKMKKDAS
jgi:hypothetical protein